MYEKGELGVKAICTTNEQGRCVNYDDLHGCRVDDSRNDYKPLEMGDAYLPHSCGEWVIGGRDQIQALIDDLQAILDAA